MSRFVDRKPQFPGRVKIIKASGSSDQYVIEKDEGSTAGPQFSEGTPLNAATLNQFENDLKQYAIDQTQGFGFLRMEIRNDGHLYLLTTGNNNPFHIDQNGHLILTI